MEEYINSDMYKFIVEQSDIRVAIYNNNQEYVFSLNIDFEMPKQLNELITGSLDEYLKNKDIKSLIYEQKFFHNYNLKIYFFSDNGYLVLLNKYHNKYDILNSTPVGAILTDENYNLEYINDYMLDTFSTEIKYFQGQNWLNKFDINSTDKIEKLYNLSHENVILDPIDVRLISPLGEEKVLSLTCYHNFEFDDLNQLKKKFLFIFTDSTHKHKYIKKLEYISKVDGLTKLYNRQALINLLSEKISNNTAEDSVLIFIDINNFKSMNDIYGHELGDKVLIEISQRMLKNTGKDDIVARIGGDEFVIYLNKVKKDETGKIIENFIDCICENVDFLNISHVITLSCGVVLYSELSGYSNYSNYEELIDFWLSSADMAMYLSKKQKIKYITYTKNINITRNINLLKEKELFRLLDGDKIMTRFQPIIQEGRVISVEALTYFDDLQSHNDISDVIESAHKFKKSSCLYQLMLKKGVENFSILCKKLEKIDKKIAPVNLNLNVDGTQMASKYFSSEIKRLFEENDIDAKQVYLEITEQALINFDSELEQNIQELIDSGIKLAMDDFGTGYSSLQRLISLPFDQIKIDKFFVNNLDSSDIIFSTVEAIVAISTHMGIHVLAEGVELEEQLNVLQNLGVKVFQGYYFCKPLKLDEAIKYIEKNNFIG